MTPPDPDRAAFEAWAAKHGWSLEYNVEAIPAILIGANSYTANYVQAGWFAWQASAAHARAGVVEAQERGWRLGMMQAMEIVCGCADDVKPDAVVRLLRAVYKPGPLGIVADIATARATREMFDAANPDYVRPYPDEIVK